MTLLLQRSFEQFALQLIGTRVHLDRLRHVYVPQSMCSAYIHHNPEVRVQVRVSELRSSRSHLGLRMSVEVLV